MTHDDPMYDHMFPARDAFFDALDAASPNPLRVTLRVDDYDVDAVNPDAIDFIVDELMMLTAEIVATTINAGSERDAVMENEDLRNALRDELTGWSPPSIMQ